MFASHRHGDLVAVRSMAGSSNVRSGSRRSPDIFHLIRLVAVSLLIALAILLLPGKLAGAQTYPNNGNDGYDTYQYGAKGLTHEQSLGRNTWYWWTGGDGKQGGQELWRKLARLTHGDLDLLQGIDSRIRPQRFKKWGVINDPDCVQATQPDQYGLWLDVCHEQPIEGIPGEPTGIVGLRRFKNPDFDPAKWNLAEYLKDPGKVEPPYLVGMACGFCHVGFNPVRPPDDPSAPHWENLHPGIGNQYFREGLFFTQNVKPDDFRWQVAIHQPAGTSDTSRIATDYINNPNAINVVTNLNERPTHVERMNDGTERPVLHILKDGADSVGSSCLGAPFNPGVDDTACAGLRVYVNIGLCADYWTQLHDPINGVRAAQKPFDIKKARAECQGWKDTEARAANVEAFLRTLKSARLFDASDGARFVTKDQAVLARGQQVFVRTCARCHSSKPLPKQDDQAAITEFFNNNFLADDARHSVVEIGTNMSRALGENALKGHIWEEFSSEGYKQQPSPGTVTLFNPVHPGKPITFTVPDGGRGYYRTPTLLGIWATAPYFHNNSLGVYNADPSVSGRIAAYEDAMQKLLYPERRLGLQSMAVTTIDSMFIQEGGAKVPIAAGTPVNLLARVKPPDLEALNRDTWVSRAFGWLIRRRAIDDVLLDMNRSPDFIEDRGHTFGAELSDEDKAALIEFMKTL